MQETGDISHIESKPDVVAYPAAHYASRKHVILVLLLVYAALLGMATAFDFWPKANRVVEFFAYMPVWILAFQWCHVDARQRDYAIGRSLNFGLALFVALAFPIYIFQTRGRGGFKTLALTALFVAAMCAAGFAAGSATMYARGLAPAVE